MIAFKPPYQHPFCPRIAPYWALFLLFLQVPTPTLAQIRCYTHEHHQIRQQQGLHTETEGVFEQWMSTRLGQGSLNPEVDYNIPVVFHVIYQNTSDAWNISAAQIQSQVDILNEDFKRLNADTLNAPANFRAVAASSNISFCLAQRDPQGNSSTGIVRWQFAQNASWSTSSIDATIKPATIWDPTRYFNIWVVNISGGVLGYAQFPVSSGLAGMPTSGSANTDGVVLLYNSVGRPPANPFSGAYNKGRTATHEVGHWLGLRHIWGDGSSCTATDYCADTPPSDAANYGCPTTHSSCSGPDMVQNYMDYSDDNCMNLFTYNQVQRMWTVLANSPRRVSLLTANSCQPVILTPGPLTTAFTASDTLADFGGAVDTVQLTDQSVGVPSTRLWTITPSTGWAFAPGSTAASANPRIYFSAAGQYSVQLKVTNSFGSDSLTRSNYLRARASACASGATDPADTRVASFAFAGTTYTSPTGSGNCATYTDRTNLPPFQVTPGQTYSATLIKGTCGGNYASYAKVFIDFNQNYQFEAGEQVMAGSMTNAANATLTAANIAVPSGAASGLCLLRVVLREAGSATTTQACSTYQWGETQDYLVQVNGTTAQPLTGTVTYQNAGSTPLSAVTVRLLDFPSQTQLSSTGTAANGAYSFSSYTNGSRLLKLSTARGWGGVNATDALLVNRHFANIANLSGLRLRAADVNLSNSVNSSDALLINRRYSNVTGSFQAGDWVFDSALVTLNGSALTRNLTGLCYGDVNGSFVPGVARLGFGNFKLEASAEGLDLAGNSVPNETFRYSPQSPSVTVLRVSEDATVGALSLDIHWPEELGVPKVVSRLGVQEPVFAWTNHRLRIAWCDVEGLQLRSNQAVLEIHHRTGDLPAVWDWDAAPGSEWASSEGLPLNNLGLRLPRPRAWREAAGLKPEVFPNPTDGKLMVRWNSRDIAGQVLPVNGTIIWELRDASGRLVGEQSGVLDSATEIQVSELDLGRLNAGIFGLTCRSSDGQAITPSVRVVVR